MSDLEQIYVCAVRYGLGRKTYITGVISDYLLFQKLSEHCRSVIKKDIEGCEDYGHECDKKSWMKLLKKVSNE